MAINKVVYDGTTLIDLSSDTLSSADQLAQGIVAHDRTGATVTGSIVIPSAGTEGTPVATKGTVSNHSISVTPSVTNTGGVIEGGTHTGTAVTVTASELASGNKEITANGTNIDVVGYSTVSVNVSGGGSSSNVVEGTFTASTTKGQAQTVNIPYTGNGYPIFAHIEVDGGMANPNTAWYTTVQRYAVGLWCMSKRLRSTSPDYSDNTEKNQSIAMESHKNSASNATTFAVGGGSTANIFTTSAASAQSATCIRFSSKNTMSVFVASTSYGLMSGVTYRYQIQYSS